MSSLNFAIPDFCPLISEPCHVRYFINAGSRVSQLGCMVLKIGFLKQLVLNPHDYSPHHNLHWRASRPGLMR